MPQKKVLKIHVHDHKIKYIVLAWQDKYWFGQVAWNAPTLAPGQQMILTVEHSHENDVLWLSNQVTGEGNVIQSHLFGLQSLYTKTNLIRIILHSALLHSP